MQNFTPSRLRSLFLVLIINFFAIPSLTKAQTTVISESYAILSTNGGGNTYYDLHAVTTHQDFQGANLGTFSSGQSLVIVGGENKIIKCNRGNVTGGNLYWRVYRTSLGASGTFTSIKMSWKEGYEITPCTYQKWEGTSGTTNVLDDLLPGRYTLEVYTDAPGYPFTEYTSNGGMDINYKANFTVGLLPDGCATFTGSSVLGNRTHWSEPSNWLLGIVPTIDRCVIIPETLELPLLPPTSVVVNIPDAVAKNVTVAAGAKLTIAKNSTLKVKEEFTNNATAADVMIESDGSLLQVDNVPNTGAISARREISIKDNSQYNYLISPLIGSNLKTNVYENQTSPGLSSAPFTLYHNENTNLFANSSGTYILGRALAVKEPAGTTGKINALFTGIPMNGSFTYTLANSPGGSAYNLIGNPYPSSIDLDLFYNLNNNKDKLSPTFYFWDNTVNSETKQLGSGYSGAAYAVFNAASGSAGTGVVAAGVVRDGVPEGVKKPTRVVKPGQGFMVRSISPENKIIDFNNSVRIPDVGDVFFGKPEKDSTEDDRFYLKLTSPSNITTQAAVVYFENGNNGFAKDDSESLGSPSDALYTFADQKKVIINGRAPFVVTDIIPLGTQHFAAGNHKISLGEREGVFATSQSIYLKDNQTNIITNLSEGDYTFTADAGESTGRFEIVYKPGGVLATDSSVKDEVTVIKNATDFMLKSHGKKITGVEVYDTAGRLIQRLAPHQTEVRINGGAMRSGVYILKIDRSGEITTKKIIR